MFNDNSITLSLPSDWIVQIQQHAERHHLTPEEWLYVEVAKLLGKPDPRSAIEVNKRLTALEAQVVGISRLEDELSRLIALVKQLSPEPFAPPTPVSKPSSVSSISSEEEDEPDEILYDFLDS